MRLVRSLVSTDQACIMYQNVTRAADKAPSHTMPSRLIDLIDACRVHYGCPKPVTAGRWPVVEAVVLTTS